MNEIHRKRWHDRPWPYLAFSFVVAAVLAEFEFGWLEILHEWQTLAAGLIALYAAVLAVRKVSDQIKQTEKLHEDTRVRKYKAARAVMPLALARICTYATQSKDYAKQFNRVGRDAGPKKPQIPKMPDDVIVAFRDIVEFSDGDVADAVTDFISEIQVQSARLEDVDSNMVGAKDLAIADAAALYVDAAKFFSYARKETEILPKRPTREEIILQLTHWGFDDKSHAAILRNVPLG